MLPNETFNPTASTEDGAALGGREWVEQLVRGVVAAVRKPTDAQTLWVSEAELAERIPYTVREIREMRKRGILKAYPDLRPGKARVLYNLFEVSAQIRAGRPVQPANLISFDPEQVEIAI